MMTRDEHLALCKRRALEYIDAGDLKNAVASMGSDLSKHPDTRAAADNPHLMAIGMLHVMQHDAPAVRRWITGFN
jgi:hypothetical protein